MKSKCIKSQKLQEDETKNSRKDEALIYFFNYLKEFQEFKFGKQFWQYKTYNDANA